MQLQVPLNPQIKIEYARELPQIVNPTNLDMSNIKSSRSQN